MSCRVSWSEGRRENGASPWGETDRALRGEVVGRGWEGTPEGRWDDPGVEMG